jgi:hypothetical protein
MTLQTFARRAGGRNWIGQEWLTPESSAAVPDLASQWLINRERGGIQMHLLRLLTVAAFIVSGSVAVATPLWVDLGPTGVVHNNRTVDSGAPDVQFAGQNMDIDFSFKNGEFIRLFTATKNSFQIDAFFRINNAPLPALNFAGSGFLVDSHGAELGPAVTLEAFPVTHHFHEVGVDLVLRPLTSDVGPNDVFGIHLDLTLPNCPGFGFGDGPPGGVTFDGNIFGIGPGIPHDIVPDFGSTAVFLTIALVGLISMRAWVTSAR